MGELKKICDNYQVNKLLHEFVEAQCQLNTLTTSYDDSEFSCGLFESIAESIPLIFDNCNELLHIVSEDLSNLKLYQEESESCIDEVQQVIDEEHAQFKQASSRAKNLKFDSTFHLNFVKAIKNQISLRENHVLEMENVYLAAQDNIQALKSEFIIKENQLNYLNEETNRLSSEIINLRKELQEREYLKWIAEEEEAKRLEEERIKKLEEEKQRLADEEESRLKKLAEEEAAKKLAEEEAEKLVEEEAARAKQLAEEQEAKKLAEEAKAKKIAADKAKKLADEEAKKAKKLNEEIEAKKIVVEKAEKLAEEEAAQANELAEEHETKKLVEETKAKKISAGKRKSAGEGKAKKIAADKAKKLADEEAKAKKLNEEIEAKKIAAEKARKLAEEKAKARKLAEEEAAQAKELAEANETKKLVEEAKAKKIVAEKAQKLAEKEAKAKKLPEKAEAKKIAADLRKESPVEKKTPIWKLASQGSKPSTPLNLPSKHPAKRLLEGSSTSFGVKMPRTSSGTQNGNASISNNFNAIEPAVINASPISYKENLDRTMDSDDDDSFFENDF